MNNKIIRTFLAFVLCLSISALSSCQSKTEAEAYKKKFPLGKAKIRAIAEISSAACDSPIFIAYEKGFFADEGIDVELVAGDAEVTKAGLQKNEFPVATEAFGYFISIYQGLDIKVVAGTHKGCVKLLTAPNSPYNTVSDLKKVKGRKLNIGLSEAVGSADHIYASIIFKKYGIDPVKDVEWLVFPPDTYNLVYEKNKLDAFVSWDPFAILAVKKEGYKLLSDQATDPVLNDAYCCFLYAPTKLINEKPELIRGLVKAYRKGADYIAANPEEAAKIDIDKKYISTDQNEIIKDLLVSYTYDAHHHNGKKQHSTKDDIRFYVTEIKALGYLPADLDVEEFVNKIYYDDIH
ncbi:MAG: ABC transporter substrate-binding protein [Endomicrobium sp.]|jgi:NitT/TauT family transport system substrate-binding protein|nr:ABC transporter substrate-binding protein [Endomicrobium sp.]